MVKETKNIFNITLLGALISMVIAALAGLFVAYMIGRPLKILRNLMKDGKQGNLTVRMKYKPSSIKSIAYEWVCEAAIRRN